MNRYASRLLPTLLLLYGVLLLTTGAAQHLKPAPLTATGNMSNMAEVITAGQADLDSTPGNHDPDEDDQASVSLTVSDVADLSLTKTVNNSTPNVGDIIQFTITLTNDGPDTATEVEVEDLLPDELTYVSDDGDGTYNPGTGRWTVYDLASEVSTTLTISAAVESSGTITNTAEVIDTDEDDPDSIPGNHDPDEDDQDSVSLIVSSVADLRLAKTVDKATPNIGDTIQFTITLTNDGPDSATSIEVKDLLPAELTFISTTMKSGNYDFGTGIWEIPNLSPGESTNLIISATVTASGNITNTAEVIAADQTDPDSPHDNHDPDEDDQDSVSLTVSDAADLSLTKTVNNSTPNMRDIIQFTITLTNSGPNTATGVVVEDVLPDGLAYVDDDGDGAYDPGIGQWAVGNLASNLSTSLIISATVTATGNIPNTAEVITADQADPDSTPGNHDPNEDDQDSVTLTAPPAADLSLTMAVDNITPTLSDTVQFTITLTNDGPDDATGVFISDTLPLSLPFVASTTTQGIYTPTTGLWDVGNLPEGNQAILTITAVVTATGNIPNTAEVITTGQFDPDSTPGNYNPGEDDQASVTLVVPNAADLVIAKTVNNTTPNPSTVTETVEITYTITVTNNGPDEATNVQVTDQLPYGLTFVSSMTTQGIYTSSTGLWEVGRLSNNTSVTLTLTAKVNSCTNGRTITNTAYSLTADQFDPVDNNEANITLTVTKDMPCLFYLPIVLKSPLLNCNLYSTLDFPKKWPVVDNKDLETKYTDDGGYIMHTRTLGLHYAIQFPDLGTRQTD